jgi:hypothetical protein
MVYGCEGDLRPDLVAEILEHAAVEVLSNVNCDLLQNSMAIDNGLLEEVFDGHGGYVGDGLRLNPLGKVFYCHNDEGVVVLSWHEFANDIDAPPL